MFIRSERLFLRPAWPEDAPDLHAAIADERIVRHLARVPWPYSAQDARAFIERPQDRRYPTLLVTLPSARGSRLIGGLGLHEDEGVAQLGYWLIPKAWGRGFMTEAASAFLHVARTLNHREIGARHFVDNPASGRVLEKIGFRRTGQVGDVHSLGRGSVAPSCKYLLRTKCSGNCDDGDSPAGEWDMSRHAA